MDAFKKAIVPVLLASLWILVSEFVRNELLFSHLWKNHYAQLGLTFPNGPVNGALWGVWSLCYAGVIYIIARRFSTFQAAGIA